MTKDGGFVYKPRGHYTGSVNRDSENRDYLACMVITGKDAKQILNTDRRFFCGLFICFTIIITLHAI